MSDGFDTTMKYEDLQQGAQKRRRIDEGYKWQQLGVKKYGAAGTVLSDFHNLDGSGKFKAEHMLSYLYAATEAMACGRNFCVQADGGRVGKPAETTYFFFMWCMEANVACVLPPQ
eukprot:6167307-Amphidinium_carterae.1